MDMRQQNHRRQTLEVFQTVYGTCLRDAHTEDRHLLWRFGSQCVALVSETHPEKTDTCGHLADSTWHLSQRRAHGRQTPVDV